MEAGTYTSPERVERNGVLVAFAGEIMTTTEAEARGLISNEAPAKPVKPGRKPAAGKATE